MSWAVFNRSSNDDATRDVKGTLPVMASFSFVGVASASKVASSILAVNHALDDAFATPDDSKLQVLSIGSNVFGPARWVLTPRQSPDGFFLGPA